MVSINHPSLAVRLDSHPTWKSSERLLPIAIGVVLATGVVAPWTGRGWLLSLDWTHGPASRLPPQFGFVAATQTSVLSNVLVNVMGRLFGVATTGWLAIGVALVVASTLAGGVTPGQLGAKAIASVFYSINPFVFERIYAGQIGLLLGYALLPIVARSLICAEPAVGWRRWAAAGWIAVDGALDVHFLWISLVILVAVTVWRHSRTAVLWAGGILLWVVVLDAYLVLPHFAQSTAVGVGASDLAAFRTMPDPTWGLYLNVIGLYGFWRAGPVLPKVYLAAWPVLSVAFAAVSAYGLSRRRRSDGRGYPTGPLLLAATFGLLLALGSRGPIGSVFDVLYHHLPGFAVMREPEKFSALLALGYAIGLGIGIEWIIGSVVRRRTRIAASLVGIAVILAYTPTIFGGLDGQVPLSHYPKDLNTAARIVGAGPGRVLALPLHDYLAFPFTQRRIIANPAPSLFRRKVLVGGEIEAGPLESDSLSPEDAYLESIVSNGSSVTRLGHLLEQLGVQYIVLFKTADYASYAWLSRQQDLDLLYNAPDIAVYLNTYALPEGARLLSQIQVPSTSCYIRLAQTDDLGGVAAVLNGKSKCPSRVISPASPKAEGLTASTLSYHARSGPGSYLVVPEPADGSWESGDRPSLRLANGVQAFKVGSAPVNVTYRGWWSPIIGDGISGVALLAMIGNIQRIRRRHSRNLSRNHI